MKPKENALAPLSRNLIRYLVGYLLLKQMVPPDIAAMLANDPFLVTAVAALLGVIVEGFWIMARKFGWAR